LAIKETLTASPAALADILSNGKRYVVPHFQRDYAWGETEWSELWTDIAELGTPAGDLGSHYLGAIVLQPTGQRGEMNIIDGQQRLVTLSLLSLAVIVRIERLAAAGADVADNIERVRLLRERFVSTKDSASLQHRSRLKLNATDDGFYQTYLVQGRAPPRPQSLQGSEERLYKAFLFFDGMVGGRFGDGATGEELARFLEDVIATRLRFIEIVVEDDETAFTVFETLNARGVALGTADLLKNYLFAVASKGGASDLDQARLWWTQVLRLVPMEHVASFLFLYLSSSVVSLREKRVFTEVKRLVPHKQSVFDFLGDLRGAAEIYAALDDPNGDLWADFDGARTNVRVLCILRAEQCRPVILAAFRRLADRPEKIARLLRNLMVISVRASAARVNTADLQRAYQSVAIQLNKGELKSPAAIARALGGVTPSDDEFRNAFAVLSVDPKGSCKRWLRYLLGELEAAAGGHVIDFEAADATIEHILPENPGGGWDAFTSEDRRRDVVRLGNLTPLERVLNRKIGSGGFEEKRAVYQESSYVLTNTIDAAEWTPAAVRVRQIELAELAVHVWRLELEE
jgi:hypothetical protein